MGQQQLLLVVLGVVIVGLAILAGIDAAEQSFKQKEADLLVNRCLMIAQNAISWKVTSNPFKGGKANYDDLKTGGFKELFLGDETENGVYRITKAVDSELEIVAVSKRFPEVGVRILVQEDQIIGSDFSFRGEIQLSR